MKPERVGQYHVPLGANISQDLADRLKRYCDTHATDRSKVIRVALLEYLDREESEENNVSSKKAAIKKGITDKAAKKA